MQVHICGIHVNFSTKPTYFCLLQLTRYSIHWHGCKNHKILFAVLGRRRQGRWTKEFKSDCCSEGEGGKKRDECVTPVGTKKIRITIMMSPAERAVAKDIPKSSFGIFQIDLKLLSSLWSNQFWVFAYLPNLLLVRLNLINCILPRIPNFFFLKLGFFKCSYHAFTSCVRPHY